MGDVVHIRTTPSITISDYSKGQKLVYEQPEPDTVDLDIDKGKSWSFVSDDVTKAQSDYNYIDDWTRDASEQLKIKIDSQILGDIYADAHASNAGATAGAESGSINLGATGSPVALTKNNVIDHLVNMGTVLDEQNVPEQNRWVIMPPWAVGKIKTSDLKDASLAGDGTSIVRNGRVGIIDRFMIYSSNNLSTTVDGSTTVTNMIFGHKSGLTFASQLLKNEGPLRFESTFGDYYRGLQVYGYSVIKAEAIGHFYAYPG